MRVPRERFDASKVNLAYVCNQKARHFVSTPDEEGRYLEAERAVTLARRACELKSDFKGYWNTLGVALYRTEQWSEAIDTLQKAIDLGGDTPYNWLFIAMADWQLDQKDKAQGWYEKSLTWKQANKEEWNKNNELQRIFAEATKLMERASAKAAQPDDCDANSLEA